MIRGTVATIQFIILCLPASCLQSKPRDYNVYRTFLCLLFCIGLKRFAQFLETRRNSVFQYMALSRMFGHTRHQVAGEWRKLLESS